MRLVKYMSGILFVEPNREAMSLFVSYLQEIKNVRIHTASSAQEAIHVCDKQTPDLVVLELQMPDQNGFAFLHEFRSHSDWLAIPVIIHSLLSEQEAGLSEKEWQQMGVVDYLYKPTTSLNTLKNRIQSVLKI